MTEIKIPPGEIPLLVQDAGLVTGLLRSSAPDLYFELDWFADAVAQIEAIPSRRGPLLKLLRDLLGKPAAGTPTDRAWYTFPVEGAPSYVYVVLPLDDTTGPASTIGIGILHGFATGPFSLRASLYVPLFEVPLGSPVAVTGSDAHPIELALDVPFGQTVTAGGVSFDGIQFLGNVTFSTPPSFTLAFRNQAPAGPQSTVSTLAALGRSDVTDWINAVLGVAGVKAWLGQKVGGSPFTVGAVLAATGILQQTGGAYTFGSLTGLADKTPQQIAELLLSKALKTLAANDKPIVALGDGGIWVFGTADGTATDYGLRLQVPDVDLSPAGGPSVLLQLGKLLSGDTDDSSWISRSDPGGAFADPGISLTLLREEADDTPAFAPRVDLVSLGLDVAGTAGNPLVDVNGVTLGSLEPRFLLSLDFADLSKIPWGVGVGFGDLGIPLGNGLGGSSATNPVAQNLLSSGSAAGSGDKEPVNPAFSAAISRVWDPANAAASVNVQLQQGGGAAETIWIPVQRAFGPLQCRRIGVEWPADNPELVLTFLFDGGVQVSALAVDLEGLSLGIPLRTPGTLDSYTLDLQGLAVAFASGPLTITGGFLKNPAATAGVQYDGAALIQTAGYSISALGSYASTGGEPSLFIFARIGAAFGGPPFFFVTGLCAGFGYNRSLRIPDLDGVPDFPLLSGIDDPSAIGGEKATPAQALASLAEYVAVAQGQNWIAAGVQFTSFELVKSNVVLAVIPTGDFQIALLGVSRIKLGQEGPQFAYAELGLRVVVQPSAGFFGASAVLSPNSYVLVPECHLTGGFAFYLWYGGEHAGDFVVTLGGYHPAFQKPAHYPDVPRLGFSWQVSPNLTIQGGAYFALTPSCAMGGGSLDVEFHAGDLHAWFRAHADFLFIWKPFYFTGSVGVSVGASYKLDLLFTSVTVSVELGAELELWGPPTGGQVHVSWFIISFTIPFGADRQPPPGYLDWSTFSTLLPQNDAKPAPLRALGGVQAGADVLTAAGDAPLENVLTASLAAGAVSTDGGRWRVRGDAMTFGIATAFPLTEADLAGKTAAKYVPDAPGYFVAVRPMGITGVTSVLTITVTGPDGVVDLGGGWSWSPSLLAVPAATWGPPLPEGTTPATPSADTLPGRLMGLSGVTPNTVQPTGPGPIPLVSLALFPINLHDSDYLPLAANEPPVGRQPQAVPTSLQTIADTITAAAPTALRGQLFAALAGFGYDAGANGPVDDIQANVNLNYPDAPLIGTPWQGAAA